MFSNSARKFSTETDLEKPETHNFPTDRQTDRPTDRPTDRQTDREAETMIYRSICVIHTYIPAGLKPLPQLEASAFTQGFRVLYEAPYSFSYLQILTT